EKESFQRNIQVLTFRDPLPIDEFTATEFEKRIIQNFAQASATIQGYKVRNYLPVKTDDGHSGFVFFAEFSIDSIRMMQAHLLLSSASRHFLITYTDLATAFEGTDTSAYDQAWRSMKSVGLDSIAPKRLDPPLRILGWVILGA